jgi:uncharacterized protein
MAKPVMVIAGASGVVGRQLIAAAQAYEVRVLSRTASDKGLETIVWNPEAAKRGDEAGLEKLAAALEGVQVLVNLAGASIAAGRLDEAHKRRVLDSRVEGTTTLVEAFKRLRRKPPVWFQASAVGFYGDRGEEELSEASSLQAGFFLSEMVKDWEAAAAPIADQTRLIVGRIALVLAKDAPAWQQFLLPIKYFVGGPLGSGKQWYPWIAADDLAKAILFLIGHGTASGIYNLTSPQPVRQLELSQKAARKLSRPAFMPVPAFALRLALGAVADALLLASAKVLPTRLQEAGFEFTYPDIDKALTNLLQ